MLFVRRSLFDVGGVDVAEVVPGRVLQVNIRGEVAFSLLVVHNVDLSLSEARSLGRRFRGLHRWSSASMWARFVVVMGGWNFVGAGEVRYLVQRGGMLTPRRARLLAAPPPSARSGTRGLHRAFPAADDLRPWLGRAALQDRSYLHLLPEVGSGDLRVWGHDKGTSRHLHEEGPL